jgi:hypothetical protein
MEMEGEWEEDEHHFESSLELLQTFLFCFSRVAVTLCDRWIFKRFSVWQVLIPCTST